MTDENVVKYEDYQILEEPYYEEIDQETLDFEGYFLNKRPLALIGPTGCGKTTLATYMAWKLRQNLTLCETVEKSKGEKGDIVDSENKMMPAIRARYLELSKAEQQRNGKIAFPYIEIPCHEDLTEYHLIGRHDVNGFIPGPLYLGAKYGGIVVLDEFIESRPDARVLIHHLTDDSRILPVPKTGEVLRLPDNFMVVACYNVGYQVKSKDLKPSTKQRFPHIEMGYAPPEKEKKIILSKVPGFDEQLAEKLVKLAGEIRKAKDTDTLQLQEGASTRLLIMAAEAYQQAKNMGRDTTLERFVRQCIFNPITTDETDKQGLEELLKIL